MTNSQTKALETLKASMAHGDNNGLVLRHLDAAGKRALAVFGPDTSVQLGNGLDLAKLTADPRRFLIGRRGKVTETGL